MSGSLSLEFDPVDQPAAKDLVERHSWCALRIRVGGRTVSRIWDRSLRDERSLLYVPAFPIARWMVQNWWVLLNEPRRSPELPRHPTAHSNFLWSKRHCLRCSDAGLLLPALYLFNNGRGVGVEWQSDERDSLPSMPGEFVDSGSDFLEKGVAEAALSQFISGVLARVAGLKDDRVAELNDQWRAIQGASAEESEFCIAAGRLGVDPYDPSEMSNDLATFIEHDLGDPERPLARDLTEVAGIEVTRVASIAEQWAWMLDTTKTLQLGPRPKLPPVNLPSAFLSPPIYDYALAHKMRDAAGVGESAPIDSIEKLAEVVDNSAFTRQVQNHLPGQGIRAIAGWSHVHGNLVAGPQPQRLDSERFLTARGLYHSLFASETSERLVTTAHTWDQQTSRAFAAELLAPQQELADQAGEQPDRSIVETLAARFVVSESVIKHQLKNAGVDILDE